jgi:hypothetical protein
VPIAGLHRHYFEGRLRRRHRSSGKVSEAGELRFKQQLDRAHRAVAVLGHDHFGDAPVGGFRVVLLVAVDHQHQVGVLLD